MQPPRFHRLAVFQTYRHKMLTCNKTELTLNILNGANYHKINISSPFFRPPKLKTTHCSLFFYRWLNSKARRLVCGSQQKAAGGPRTSTLLPLMSPHQMKPDGSTRSVCSVFLSVYGLQMIFFLPRASVSEFTTIHKYKVTEFNFQTYTS